MIYPEIKIGDYFRFIYDNIYIYKRISEKYYKRVYRIDDEVICETILPTDIHYEFHIKEPVMINCHYCKRLNRPETIKRLLDGTTTY